MYPDDTLRLFICDVHHSLHFLCQDIKTLRQKKRHYYLFYVLGVLALVLLAR